MKSYNICVIKGDGIGPEICDEAIKVLDSVSMKFGFELNYKYFLMGGAAIDVFGEPLPEETLQGALNSDAVLFGAIGGPKWDKMPRELRPESGLLKLRKALETYASLRPAKSFSSLLDISTIKPEVLENVDLMIIRELTGGLYYGEPRKLEADRAFNTMIYSSSEIKRISKIAFESAMLRNKKVCLIDKANILETSQLWREIVSDQALKFPEVDLSFMYADNAAMQLIKNPSQFDVILTQNVFGDILSDEAAMVCGSIGLLPSAAIGDKVGIFEPIHGAAPDIAGQGIANPIAMILSAAMMLRYALKQGEAADIIEQAVDMALEKGCRTKDLSSPQAKELCTTSEIGSIISENVQKL